MRKFSQSLNPKNIDKSVSDTQIRIRFPFKSSFWISVSCCKLIILPDIQPANRIVITSGFRSVKQRWPESLFQTAAALLFQNLWIRVRIRVRKFFIFENPTPVQTPATIIDPTVIHPCLYFKKWPHRLLLLSKWKSYSGSGFSQNFDSGSERKGKNPAGVDSGNPGPFPPLVWKTHLRNCFPVPVVWKSRLRNRFPVK